MAYTKYSLTPADNNAAPPNGAPEGMLPSAVNDTMRDMMAQIRDVGDGIRGGTYTMTAPVITGGSINGTTTITTSGAISYTGTLTGGTGIVNLGSGQFYKDASGNIGIGTTSPSSLGGTTLQVQNSTIGAILWSDGTRIGELLASSAANISVGARSNHALVLVTNDTERMRIDTSGNVGIGTSSPGRRLDVSAATGLIGITSSTGTNYAAFQALNTGGTMTLGLEGSSPVIFSGSTAYSAIFGTGGAYSLHLATNNTVRATIDSSGRLFVNQTGQLGNTAQRMGLQFNSSVEWGLNITSSNTATGNAINFTNSSGTQIGQIQTSTTATAYVTSSDYRLKENVLPMAGALAKVAQLKPCTYTWKSTGEASQGFIAHELQEVCPDAVSGVKDEVNNDGSIKPQGIDTSFLVATLTAAIQELKAEFDAYKATHP